MKPRMATGALALALAALVCVSLVVGPGDVELSTVWRIIAAGGRNPDAPVEAALVWDLRLPRTLLAAIVGAALAAAGVVTQGLFRNPLAEPGVLGVSSGAATLAVIGFALGFDDAGLWVTPAMAGLGAIAVLSILLGWTRPVDGFATLLLGGIAIGALCSAITTLVLAVGTERWDLGLQIVRWLMGSFEGRSWSHLLATLVPLLAGLGLCVWLRLDLDALQLGPDTAESLGIDLRQTRWLSLAAVGLLVGMATAVAGVIGFIGLVVPHVARLWIGAGHRALLPVATSLGAVALVCVDLAARASPDYALPPGAITSLVGAPVFLWMLRRHAREVG